MPSERPILFSGPMVRAILEGRKTQTRRPIKLQPTEPVREAVPSLLAHRGDLFDFRRDGHNPEARRCPYGAPGERLWVRETHALGNPLSDGAPSCQVAYRADLTWGSHAGDIYLRHGFVIDGSGRHPWPAEARGQSRGLAAFQDRWRPSIHMPRWASRITLEVTGVRVERLQDITYEDLRAEGVLSAFEQEKCLASFVGAQYQRDIWREKWDAINGKRAPYASNPWVWVVEFRRLP